MEGTVQQVLKQRPCMQLQQQLASLEVPGPAVCSERPQWACLDDLLALDLDGGDDNEAHEAAGAE